MARHYPTCWKYGSEKVKVLMDFTFLWRKQSIQKIKTHTNNIRYVIQKELNKVGR